jgi:hypothetical protein
VVGGTLVAGSGFAGGADDARTCVAIGYHEEATAEQASGGWHGGTLATHDVGRNWGVVRGGTGLTTMVTRRDPTSRTIAVDARQDVFFAALPAVVAPPVEPAVSLMLRKPGAALSVSRP